MARRFLVSDLLTRGRKRADKDGDESLQDSDLQALMSEVYGALYCAVAGTGHRYFETSDTIATTGAVSYTEPSDHLGTIRVERQIDDAGRTEPLREIGPQEQTYWRGMTGTATRVCFVDDQIYLHPTPPTGQTYIVRYIPQPPDLTTYATTDSVDVVTPAGEAFLLWGMAVLAKGESEADVRLAMAERDKALDDLIEWASLRAFSQSPSPFVEDDAYFQQQWLNPAGFWNRPT